MFPPNFLGAMGGATGGQNPAGANMGAGALNMNALGLAGGLAGGQLGNPAAAMNMMNMNPTMQALYQVQCRNALRACMLPCTTTATPTLTQRCLPLQQYALRWAAMQKFAAAAQANAAASMGMGAAMGGPPMGSGPMGGDFSQGGPGPRGPGGLRGGPGGPRGGPGGPRQGGMGGGPQQQEADPGVFYKTRICNKWVWNTPC